MNRLESNSEQPERRIVRKECPKNRADVKYIVRLKKSEGLTFTCYSEQLQGIVVHWDVFQRRTEGHYEPISICDGCKQDKPRKTLYYIYGHWIEKDKHCFLELPEGAAINLRESLAAGESLRGCGIHVTRGNGQKAHIKTRLMNRFQHPEALPKDVDVIGTLESLWNEKRDGTQAPPDVRADKNGKHLNGSYL